MLKSQLRFLSFFLFSLSVFTPVLATQNDLAGPPGSGAFGTQVVVLPNGNVVITDPNYTEGGVANIGAVYLFEGSTLSLISALKGGTPNDRIGQGIAVLTNGNFVITSPSWNNGAATSAGAVTLCNSNIGCNGTVTPANSLVGSTTTDFVGTVVPLPNGNYVVTSTDWDKPSPLTRDVGAVTFCSGITGCTGIITAQNSLTGSRFANRVGQITILADGDYVVNSPLWDTDAGSGSNGSDVGAVTFCRGTLGCTGEVNSLNSLTGNKVGHPGGGGRGVVPLANGNYVVVAPLYFGPDTLPNNPNPFGAAVFCNGTSGCIGSVASNVALVGSANGQSVSNNGVTPLPNGNYLVNSPSWDNVGTVNVGAVTFCSGITGCNGFIDATNSLIGSTALDSVGSAALPSQSGQMLDPTTVLPNGNYVVASPAWDNGTKVDVGAATLCNGTTGCVGTITSENSVVGSTANDTVGHSSFARAGGYRGRGVFALNNSNYVVDTPSWDNGTITDVGAVTLCNGTTNSCAGKVISSANSLVGSKAGDGVGTDGVIALTNGCANGNYVVSSSNWNNGAIQGVGAVTLCNGETGCTGVVSASNSFIGSKTFDLIANVIRALPNGGFVLQSDRWDNGALTDAGAVTFCNGISGCFGTIGASNSLVGSHANDRVSADITALASGNYLVTSPSWDDGAIADAGALTFCNGATGCKGAISASNSLIGSKASDQVGSSGFFGNFSKLPNGNYVVPNQNWDNGSLANAGAVTFGDGTNGTIGPITAANSILGTVANGGFFSISYDTLRNRLFVGRGAANTVGILFFETTAIADGNLSNGGIWSGSIPNALVNVIIPAGRTVTVDANASMGSLSVANGAQLLMNANLSITGNLTINTLLNTGPNTLSLGCSTRVEDTSSDNYIIGNLKKHFCALDTFSFPTGTASGYSPLNVAVTGLCQNPSSLTVRTNQGTRAGMDPLQSLQRYWTLTESGDLTADLLFNYLEIDVVGNEPNYKLHKWEGESATLMPGTVSTGVNTVSINGISEFSDWAIGSLAGTNTAPTLTNPGAQTANEGDNLSLTIQSFDANGDTLTFTASGLPPGLSVNPATGGITGTLDFNSAGTYAITVTVSDGSLTASTSFEWIVSNVNRSPTTSNDSVTTLEDTAVNIAVISNDVDLDGDEMTVSAVTNGTHGTAVTNADGTITYTPAPNFFGSDSFTYTVSDGQGGTAAATVTVAISSVNDAPIAFDGAVTLNEDNSIEITLFASDVDTSSLNFALVRLAVNGTLSPIVNGKVIYTPDPNFNGVDVFTFLANDGTADSNTATFAINVSPIADLPVLATVGNQTVAEGALLSFNLSATDPDGEQLTFTASGVPSGATFDPVTGAFLWTPNNNQAGSYVVTFVVTDPTGRSATETITITVTDVQTNLGPVCSEAFPSIGEIWPPDHHTETIDILGVTDPDNDPITIIIRKILQDEPTNTLGDGNTAIDGGGTSTSRAWVRAERSGPRRTPGNGRVYEIFFEASDGRGKSCTGSIKVSVPHDQGRGPATDDGKRYDSTVAGGQCLNCNP